MEFGERQMFAMLRKFSEAVRKLAADIVLAKVKHVSLRVDTHFRVITTIASKVKVIHEFRSPREK